MVQKVVYNNCFGGFGLREEVIEWVRANEDRLSNEYNDSDVQELVEQTLAGEAYGDGNKRRASRTYIHDTSLSRDNELLADIVVRETAYDGRINSTHSSLQVAEVPDGIKWTIDEYDGRETVEEASRTFS